jgi:hypothetical protein
MERVWMRIVAALEIIGGIFGLVFVLSWFLAAPFSVPALLIAPIPIGIYVLSLAAGIALWRGSPFGRKASIVVQAIQVPKIISPSVIFMFSFGLDLWIHYLWLGEFSRLGFEVRFLAFNEFFFNAQGAPIGFGISITACATLLLLLRKYKPSATSDITLPPPPQTEWNVNPSAAPNVLSQQSKDGGLDPL